LGRWDNQQDFKLTLCWEIYAFPTFFLGNQTAFKLVLFVFYFFSSTGSEKPKKKTKKKTKKRTRNSGRTSSGRLRRKGVARSGPDGEPLLLEVLLALHGELLAPDVGVESGAFSWRLKGERGGKVKSGVLGGSEGGR